MPLKMIQNETEIEREIGYKYLQMLSRAEALVPGAGREAIEALLWDANAVIIRADVQNDRVVLDGTLNCQAVYRQGEETSLRAVSAKATISQVTEIPGAQGGMLCRVQPVVENVEAGYENGHMVFQVSIGVHVRVMKLESIPLITGLEDAENMEARFRDCRFTRLAAEATETAVLTERVELPQALDARTTLMDWGSVRIESAEADLGGVRVKGRATVETLIASGMEGRPAVQVKYPIEFDKLLELPEWLSRNACVTPSVRNIRTQLEQADADEDASLMIQADVHFSIAANLTENVNVLEDLYSLSGRQVEAQRSRICACSEALCLNAVETVRGTVLLDEGSPSAASVIAVRVQPGIAEIETDAGGTRITGLLEAAVLYMPVGSDYPASARTRLPFEIRLARKLGENPQILLNVVSAEANALMSDRLEMKIALGIECEDRLQQEIMAVEDVRETDFAERRPGYIICWPEGDDDAWSIARRYRVPLSSVSGDGKISSGEALILRV